MPLYNFNSRQEFSTIDQMPDFRSDEEKVNSPLSIYNHQNPDIAYAERMAEEIINLSGAMITVFKRRRGDRKDEIFEEDADPTYEKAVKLKGRFVPEPAKIVLSRFGVDTPIRTTISFSRANVIKQFGNKMISEGDILLVPHNTMAVTQNTDLRDGPGNLITKFRVINGFDTGNYKYRWIYWSVLTENITGDSTIDVTFTNEKV